VAALAAPVAKPGGARPSDIAHIGVPDNGSRRALCGAPVRGVPAPPGVGECVVCTELWRACSTLAQVPGDRWGGV
jgi:hypothetical protein